MKTVTHYATVVSFECIPQLGALVASMNRHCTPFALHVLCWDVETLDWCEARRSRGVVGELAGRRPDLFPILPGPSRTKAELIWTVRSAWSAEVAEKNGGRVVQLDADLMFFSTPADVLKEMSAARLGVVRHWFSFAEDGRPGPTYESHSHRYGAFNAGLVVINDPKVALRWAQLTRAWCYNYSTRVDGEDRYSDQKYLEQLDEEYDVHMFESPGVMVGPWNVHRMVFEDHGGVLHASGSPVVTYHYHSFRMNPDGTVAQYAHPEYELTEEHIRIFYDPYVRELRGAL